MINSLKRYHFETLRGFQPTNKTKNRGWIFIPGFFIVLFVFSEENPILLMRMHPFAPVFIAGLCRGGADVIDRRVLNVKGKGLALSFAGYIHIFAFAAA